MKKERDLSIDFFRFIGLTAIIFAHSGISDYLFQLRNFDVPLMVFVGGYSAYNFSSKIQDFSSYVKDRFLRLVVPTWIFVTIYLVFRQMLGDGLSTGDMIESYLMTGGPLGVWIVRVFFLMALFTPLMVRLAKKEGNHFLIIILILVVNEIVSLYFKELPRPRSIPTRLVFIFLLYNCSYGVVLYFGAIWGKLKRNNQFVFSAVCLVCFLAMAGYHYIANDSFVWTQEFKNPPMIYYLSYALLISSILFLIKDTRLLQALSGNRLTTFIGSRTLWIYLWHWLFLYIYEEYFPPMDLWVYKFLFAFTTATITTLLQDRIIGRIGSMLSPDHRTLLKKIFIG